MWLGVRGGPAVAPTPSLTLPLGPPHLSSQRLVQFWFATGGAGFCINRQLALKMAPWAR